MATEHTTEEFQFAIGGMTCASCVARVEKAIRAVPGVAEATVNLATSRAHIAVQPGLVDGARLSAAIVDAGYTATDPPAEPGSADAAEDREHAALRRAALLAAGLSVPLTPRRCRCRAATNPSPPLLPRPQTIETPAPLGASRSISSATARPAFSIKFSAGTPSTSIAWRSSSRISCALSSGQQTGCASNALPVGR